MSDETKCKLILLASLLLISCPFLALTTCNVVGHLLGAK